MESTSFCPLDQLIALVEQSLADDYAGVDNGRVRDLPDRRTVRFYTTLGLLDRPAELRGRTAYYARKHLLQLVAVKRLQARGLTLTQIQQQLLGLKSAELESLAQVPANLLPEAPLQPEVETAFWKEMPAEPVASPVRCEPEWYSVNLEKEVLLLLSLRRPLRADDREALHAAAAPLLELLRTRQLVND